MVSVYDVDPNALISAVAKTLASDPAFKAPEWSKFVKTGRHKQRPPLNTNWWQTRLAAVLRTVSINGPVGVQRLRSKYGGRKKFGCKPKGSVKGSGSIIRKVLQQLETAGLINKSKNKTGRVITNKGQSMLDKAAAIIGRK